MQVTCQVTCDHVSSDECQVITYMCQVVIHQVINKVSVNTINIVLLNNIIQENGTDTRDRYEYRKIIQF